MFGRAASNQCVQNPDLALAPANAHRADTPILACLLYVHVCGNVLLSGERAS